MSYFFDSHGQLWQALWGRHKYQDRNGQEVEPFGPTGAAVPVRRLSAAGIAPRPGQTAHAAAHGRVTVSEDGWSLLDAERDWPPTDEAWDTRHRLHSRWDEAAIVLPPQTT